MGQQRTEPPEADPKSNVLKQNNRKNKNEKSDNGLK